MTEAGRFALCLALALGLHAGALPPGNGPLQGAAGAGGANEISLAAADGAVLALVAAWQTPPRVQPLAGEVPPPPAAEAGLPPPATPVRPQSLSLPAPGRAAAAAPEPAPQVSAPPAPPVPALRARGAGDGARAGAGARAAHPGDTGQAQDALAAWGAQIRARIERGARAARGRGAVTLGLRLAASGALQSVTIRHSSGQPGLDGAALQAARSAAPFPAAPAGLGAAPRDFRIALRFGR